MPSISVSSPFERSAGSLGGRLGLVSWAEDVLGCLLIMSFGPQCVGSAGLAPPSLGELCVERKTAAQRTCRCAFRRFGGGGFNHDFSMQRGSVNYEFPERDAWLQSASIFFPE